MDPKVALKLCQENCRKTFDESIAIAVMLGVDPQKQGQNVRCQAVVNSNNNLATTWNREKI